MKDLKASPQFPPQLLLLKHLKSLRRRLHIMHDLAHDACGQYNAIEVHDLRKELSRTKKDLLQLIALTELKK